MSQRIVDQTTLNQSDCTCNNSQIEVSLERQMDTLQSMKLIAKIVKPGSFTEGRGTFIRGLERIAGKIGTRSPLERNARLLFNGTDGLESVEEVTTDLCGMVGIGVLPVSAAGTLQDAEILVRLLPEHTLCIDEVVVLHHVDRRFDRMVRRGIDFLRCETALHTVLGCSVH